MNPHDVRKLLGGYATGTLTESERQTLFAAALEDQELFEALADEEALRELLADPATRRRLIADLTEPQGSWAAGWRRFLRPPVLAFAGTVAVVLVTLTAVHLRRREPVEIAQVKAPVAPREEPAPPEAEPARKPAAPALAESFRSSGGGAAPPPAAAPAAQPEAKRKESLSKDADLTASRGRDEERAAPAETAKTETVANKKIAGAVRQDALAAPLRVVVVNSPASVAGPESNRRLEAAVATQLGQKLNQPPGYAVVDQREVDKALADRKLTNQELDAVAAVGLARALKADAVVVSNLVQPLAPAQTQAAASPPPAPGAAAATGPLSDRAFQKQRLGARAAQQQNRAQVQGQAAGVLTAEVIDTRNEARRFKAIGSVDEVASQVSTQLAQIRGPGPEIHVRAVTGASVVLDAGSRLGIAEGARIEIRRQGRLLGEVTVTKVNEESAEGTFSGTEIPHLGDLAVPK